MDVQAIISQVTEALGNAPEKVQDLMADPKGTIEEITGQTLGEGDLSQIVDGVKESVANGGFDLGNLDLSAITENLGGLGDLLGNSPLGGIAEGLGGLFRRK